MAKFRRRSSEEANVDMTPMLDIVFIMLIFFIVTAVFLDETGLALAQPDAAETPPTDRPSIQVYIDEDNRVSVDRVPVELSGVPARIERLLADKPDASVLITADRRAALDPVVFVKDQMDIAGRPVVLKVLP